MKNILKILTALGLWLVLLTIVYFAFAFGKWDLNPANWVDDRGLAALCGVVMLVPSTVLTISIFEK